MHHLRDLTVLILGLGDSGLAMARWCARCGANVHVADTRAHPPQAATLAAQVPAATLHHGLDPVLLAGVNLVLKSPGLVPEAPEVAPLLARADALGIPVRGELSLFASALADLKAEMGYAPKVVAITGTNGKTTTTSLTAKLIERAGLRVGLAGNIGPTLLDTLREALEHEPTRLPEGGDALADALENAADVLPEQQPVNAVAEVGDEALPENGEPPLPVGEDGDLAVPAQGLSDDASDADAPLVQLAPPPPAAPTFEVLPEAWVLELSSFQLDGVKHFEPDAAVVLNVTQDHLDWHGTMVAYAAAKSRIYGQHATMVVNRDEPLVEAMIPAPEVVKSGVRGRPARVVHRKVVRFGLDAPCAPGDFGLVVESGMAWLVRAMEADPTIKRAKGAKPEDDEIILQRLMPADALRIRGRHNASNALAALALATAIGCPLAPMLHGLREYRGEPHRVEHVMTLRGVDAIDDSKGTNVGATVAALLGLGADLSPGKLSLILGGDGKGQDFGPLREPVGRFARAVALIGRDAEAIGQVLAGVQSPAGDDIVLQRFDSLEAATAWAFEQAAEGDALLLSPACASLDMFRNYAHRAEVFVKTLQALATDLGDIA
ncbi:UDP-N-acetylmuramoyl-L-alanine--D-glutamate ligase [Aquabacterium sp.]|uniref:UDP-N-acetylmuramoyl-L-alanine--D-glutamate ligase n=1 Tax=Aquabacterium sp. TaxID=1872578 RepID=UPI00248A3D13|nr:UDP-N-acetylmuramoyl-L-alanine--D-glutamate ligase [Aquabacterium sp.]MDI1350233.1 UDP-N-acetylmuramoyl-L-alanine--D-glutamate ligase [Aquabacterium sp.]